MSDFDPENSRAHWQRTEAMVMYDEEFRKIFPYILEQVDPARVVDNTYCPTHGLDLAWTAAHFIENVPFKFMVSPMDWRVIRNNDHFTHAGIEVALQEAVSSIVAFPLNVLHVANMQRPKHVTSMTRELGTIATVFEQPFFSKLCETSAFTTNGVWNHFSTHVRYPPEPRLWRYLEFDFSDGDEAIPTFDLRESSKQALRASLRDKNRRAIALYSTGHQSESDELGTSSGCPVARLAPQFSGHAQDQARLTALANCYGKSVDEITAPRPETTIAFGLRQFSDYLGRVAQLLQ